MDFRKCPRCGSFYHSDCEVCQNCKTNENLDVQKLRNYFEENGVGMGTTVQEISVQTGINSRNLNRYLISEEFAGKVNQDILGNYGNNAENYGGTTGNNGGDYGTTGGTYTGDVVGNGENID